MDQEKIGVFISTLRKEQGMTQQQLADAIGVSNKTISKWECGKGMPELALMVPLCNILQISTAIEGVSCDAGYAIRYTNLLNLLFICMPRSLTC